MSHAVLKQRENKCCEDIKEIILEDLQISDDIAFINEVDSRKLEDFSNYAKYHAELTDIDKVKRIIAFRNWGIY